ncbi:MAG TPA: PD-(D/E)XK nuclease family protein, partial [Thermoleophilaceae bacterium]
RAHVFTDDEAEDPSARQALRAALTQVAALEGSGVAPARERLHDLLAELPVRLGFEPAPDRVQVARPESIRARRFHAVFVCGLQEGEFPRPPQPEPFLSDDERRELAQASGLVLPFRDDRPARERYLFYACASRAERLLALSWRDTDEEGAPQVRSFLVDDVRDVLDAAELDGNLRRRPLAQVTWSPEDAPTAVEWERAMALAGPDRSSPPPERLDAVEVLEELRSRDRLSAAALESYSDCPVKWLVERFLDPEALEPDPEPMVRGRYAHAVLELTYRRLAGETGSRRVTPDSLPAAERILLAALREREGEFRISPTATRVRTAVRRLEFDLLRHLRAEAEAGGAFEPAELELEFGMEGSLRPPVQVGDGLAVRGRIDRVDTWDGYFLVRDYKSGKRVHPVASWERDRRLQVALYMIAVRELLGLEPAGGVYVPLSGPKRLSRGIVLEELRQELGGGFGDRDFKSREEIEEQLERARERALELAGRMRSGEVRPCPGTCAWNGGCSYPSICRVEG